MELKTLFMYALLAWSSNTVDSAPVTVGLFMAETRVEARRQCEDAVLEYNDAYRGRAVGYGLLRLACVLREARP